MLYFDPKHPGNFSATGKPLHPFCNVCGWRKGGLDSWNGRACKCGDMSPPFTELCRQWNAASAAIDKAKGAPR